MNYGNLPPGDVDQFSLMYSADLQLSEPMTGMLDTDAPENGETPAMQGSGDAILPDLQANWTMSNDAAPQMDQYQLENTHLFPVDGLAQEGSVQAGEKHDEGDGTTAPDEQKPAEPTPTSDAGSPSNMELEDAGKEGGEEGSAMVISEAAPEEPPFPSEYDRLNKVVEESPDDFNGWVYLLQYVEQEVSPFKQQQEQQYSVFAKRFIKARKLFYSERVVNFSHCNV